MPSHKVRFEICGSSYTVSTSDSEDYMLGLAKRLDDDIRQLMSKNSSVSVTTAAVMVALSFLDESLKTSLSMDNMRGQIQSYLEDAARSKSSEVDIRKELDQTRRELEKAKEKLAEMSSIEKESGLIQPAKHAEPSVLHQPQESTLKVDFGGITQTLSPEKPITEQENTDATEKEHIGETEQESTDATEAKQMPEPPHFFFESPAEADYVEDFYPGQIRFEEE